MHWFNGQLGQILRCRTFLFVSICRSWSHISYSSDTVCVELRYRNHSMGFQLSGAPEPPSEIQIMSSLSLLGALDTRIAKEFRIFTESTMLNNLQSIAQGNSYQHLNSPETDPAQYISNHPGIAQLSKRYGVFVAYPETQLTYCKLTRRMQTCISLV